MDKNQWNVESKQTFSSIVGKTAFCWINCSIYCNISGSHQCRLKFRVHRHLSWPWNALNFIECFLSLLFLKVPCVSYYITAQADGKAGVSSAFDVLCNKKPKRLPSEVLAQNKQSDLDVFTCFGQLDHIQSFLWTKTRTDVRLKFQSRSEKSEWRQQSVQIPDQSLNLRKYWQTGSKRTKFYAIPGGSCCLKQLVGVLANKWTCQCETNHKRHWRRSNYWICRSWLETNILPRHWWSWQQKMPTTECHTNSAPFPKGFCRVLWKPNAQTINSPTIHRWLRCHLISFLDKSRLSFWPLLFQLPFNREHTRILWRCGR